MSKSYLYGIVVCGGQSSRMGKDKSLINYHGKPQRYYLYDLLKPLCDQVFVSCNKEQAKDIVAGYSYVVDKEEYSDMGPMGGLLSAFDNFPGTDFLFVGCDYPLFNEQALAKLIEAAAKASYAACYFSETEEPLIAIYKNSLRSILFSFYEQQQFSLRKLLHEVDAMKLLPDDNKILQSIDTPEQYEQIQVILKNKNPSL